MPLLSDCYAHSLPGQPVEKWQKLEAHLSQVAGQAAGYAAPFQSEDWAWNAGWLHDLGKATKEFQDYLLLANELIDQDYDGCATGRNNHSSAGAALAEKKYSQLIGRTLAYLAAGHHAGLTDFHSSEVGRAALTERIKEGKSDLELIVKSGGEILPRLKCMTRPPVFVKSTDYHLWVRMLFSCLVDADYLNTEAFMQPEIAEARVPYPALDLLKARFDHHMQAIGEKAAATPVNSIRREILAASRAAARLEPGLFSMTVPTGGGKTLSSMAFALDHANQHGKTKIIYVIPYTSIIEQTAKILADIFGPENVVEHHSNLDPERETQRSRLASENWDAPVIVTTNVQFFESLFAAKPGRCRKLHNLVNSVVILDEAQLLPPNWLVPCVDAINQLVSHYKVSLVLSTATQPALPGLARSCEIVSDVTRLYGQLKRTEIHLPPDLNTPTAWEDLANELQSYDQVLCIVNTRKDCHTLYRLMPEGTIHLSALMCGAHRSKVIAEIKERLKEGKPARVISTQLVEAGVDLDFPVVYRALAGLDSIAQAAGRCNREGKLEGLGQVHVFIPPKDPPRGLLRKGADKTRELAGSAFDLQAPESFTRYFERFYEAVNDMGKDWLKKHLVRSDLDLEFRSAAREFQFIDDQAQQTVIVLYDGSEDWIRRLRAAGPAREIMRHLQRYTVNLSRRLVNAMLADGRLEMLDSGLLVQCLPGAYDKNVGLDVFNEQMPVEDLMV